VIAYTLLTFAASWTLWTAALVIQGGRFAQPGLLAPVGTALYLLGVFAPALVAVALVSRRGGAAARTHLLGRTLAWSVDVRWYAFAVLYYPVVKLSVAIAHRLAYGGWPPFADVPIALMLAGAAISTPAQAGEEIGWRGFLLPALAARVGLPAASVIVGIIWAAWHLPFFFMPGTDKTGQSFPAYAAGVIALSVAMAFLYWRTRGSLFLTMVMHASVNNLRLIASAPSSGSPFALQASFVAWGTVGVMWIVAAGLLVAMRKARDA
jgi:membrane protease YdiL (CAAX protease family)